MTLQVQAVNESVNTIVTCTLSSAVCLVLHPSHQKDTNVWVVSLWSTRIHLQKNAFIFEKTETFRVILPIKNCKMNVLIKIINVPSLIIKGLLLFKKSPHIMLFGWVSTSAENAFLWKSTSYNYSNINGWAVGFEVIKRKKLVIIAVQRWESWYNFPNTAPAKYCWSCSVDICEQHVRLQINWNFKTTHILKPVFLASVSQKKNLIRDVQFIDIKSGVLSMTNVLHVRAWSNLLLSAAHFCNLKLDPPDLTEHTLRQLKYTRK